VCVLIGVLQLATALLKLPRWRQFAAVMAMIFFGGLTISVQTETGRAAYSGWVIANLLIVARIY
jgi:hypothetical protein